MNNNLCTILVISFVFLLSTTSKAMEDPDIVDQKTCIPDEILAPIARRPIKQKALHINILCHPELKLLSKTLCGKLERNRIQTLTDIVTKSPEELQRLDGVNEKECEKIEHALKYFDDPGSNLFFHLGMKCDPNTLSYIIGLAVLFKLGNEELMGRPLIAKELMIRYEVNPNFPILSYHE